NKAYPPALLPGISALLVMGPPTRLPGAVMGWMASTHSLSSFHSLSLLSLPLSLSLPPMLFQSASGALLRAYNIRLSPARPRPLRQCRAGRMEEGGDRRRGRGREWERESE